MMKKTTSPWRRIAALLCVAPLAVTACSPQADDSESAGATDAAAERSHQQEVNLYSGVGSFASEYSIAQVDGAEAMVSSLSTAHHEAFASDFDGQKLLSQFSAVLSNRCDACGIFADPASNAFTQAMVEQADAAGAYIVTMWNKPEDIQPWDEPWGDHWVAHQAFDGVDSGYQNAVALFEAMGGQGNVVALQGVLDNPPAQQRFAGLQKALEEYPDVTLLEDQVGNWDQTRAQEIVDAWLSKYGNDIDGIWSANDGMALGAVEALRRAGRAGEVPVTGSDGSTDALELVKSGEMVSTMFIDGAYQGALGNALIYAAVVGDIVPSELPHEQRAFYLEQTLVTADNVEEFLDREVDLEEYSYERLSQDFWARSAGPLDF